MNTNTNLESHTDRADTAEGASLRRGFRSMVTIVAAALLVALLGACESDKAELDAVRDAVNSSRAQAGLPALTENLILDLKADAWAQNMRNQCRISHSSLIDGAPPQWSRLAENVGKGASAAEIHAAYMNSTSHRTNILQPAFDQIGTAAVWGNCNGHRTLFTVQVFMTS